MKKTKENPIPKCNRCGKEAPIDKEKSNGIGLYIKQKNLANVVESLKSILANKLTMNILVLNALYGLRGLFIYFITDTQRKGGYQYCSREQVTAIT